MIESVSTHTRQPPHSYFIAWYSKIRNMVYTISVIFCSSEVFGLKQQRESIHSCQTEHCNKLLQNTHMLLKHILKYILEIDKTAKSRILHASKNCYMKASLGFHTEDFARAHNLLKQQWSWICPHEFHLLGDLVIYFIYLCIEQATLPPVFSAVIKQFNHIREKGSPDLQSFWTLWRITDQDCNNLQNLCKTVHE